jgi:hypothetical protein
MQLASVQMQLASVKSPVSTHHTLISVQSPRPPSEEQLCQYIFLPHNTTKHHQVSRSPENYYCITLQTYTAMTLCKTMKYNKSIISEDTTNCDTHCIANYHQTVHCDTHCIANYHQTVHCDTHCIANYYHTVHCDTHYIANYHQTVHCNRHCIANYHQTVHCDTHCIANYHHTVHCDRHCIANYQQTVYCNRHCIANYHHTVLCDRHCIANNHHTVHLHIYSFYQNNKPWNKFQ